MMQLFMRTVEKHDCELDLWMSCFNLWNYKSIYFLWEEVDYMLKDKHDSRRSSRIKPYVKRKREKTQKSYYNDIF